MLRCFSSAVIQASRNEQNMGVHSRWNTLVVTLGSEECILGYMQCLNRVELGNIL